MSKSLQSTREQRRRGVSFFARMLRVRGNTSHAGWRLGLVAIRRTNTSSNASKPENQVESSTKDEKKSNTDGHSFAASGLSDSSDPLALRKAAWKYGILSVLFGVVAGIIQYKRSFRGESSATQSSPSATENRVPEALVELELTQIELESQLKRLGASNKTEESLQEMERIQQQLAQVEKELKTYRQTKS